MKRCTYQLSQTDDDKFINVMSCSCYCILSLFCGFAVILSGYGNVPTWQWERNAEVGVWNSLYISLWQIGNLYTYMFEFRLYCYHCTYLCRTSYLSNIWEFVYFVCVLSPKRHFVRWRNFAHKRLTTMCRTCTGFLCLCVVVMKIMTFSQNACR